MNRSRLQGIYRLAKAIDELSVLEDSIKGIKDEMDEELISLGIEEIKWYIREGLKDLMEGEQ